MKLWPRSRKSQRRLKKQPKLRRMQSSAVTAPPLSLPPTARKRRKRNQRRVNLPTNLLWQFVTSTRWVSLALLIGMVYLLNLVGSRPEYYLTVIPVEGVFSIPPAEIVDASGLAGQHIFAADPNEAATAVAETPGILAASVTLEWPSRVHIQIEEDRPVAIWEQNGEPYWINRQGRLLPARKELPGLLRISTASEHGLLRPLADPAVATAEELSAETAEAETEPAVVDDPLINSTVPHHILHGALLLKELAPNNQSLRSLRYSADAGLTFTDERGWEVQVGTGEDMSQKLAMYTAIVDELLANGKTPTYISISNKDKPFYMAQEQ